MYTISKTLAQAGVFVHKTHLNIFTQKGYLKSWFPFFNNNPSIHLMIEGAEKRREHYLEAGNPHMDEDELAHRNEGVDWHNAEIELEESKSDLDLIVSGLSPKVQEAWKRYLEAESNIRRLRNLFPNQR